MLQVAWTASVLMARSRRSSGKLSSEVTRAMREHSRTFSVPRCRPDTMQDSGGAIGKLD